MSIVLNLHEVHDPIWLENIVYFLEKNYHLVGLQELISSSGNSNGQKATCHITVDDGDKTFYNVIYPVLKKRKIPATIFVSPYLVINRLNFWFQEIASFDKRKLLKVIKEIMNIDESDIKNYSLFDVFKCLTIEQISEIINTYRVRYHHGKVPFQNMNLNELKEVEHSGLICIGAHTLRHPILANEEMHVAKNEILRSITDLEDLLGHEIISFAYPNGVPALDFGQREMEILKDCGCKYSFSTESGNFNSGSDLLSIRRYGLNCGDPVYYFKAKLLLGTQWNKLMKLKPRNEYRNRKAVRAIIKHHDENN